VVPLASRGAQVNDRTSSRDLGVTTSREARIAALFDEHYPGLCRLAALLLGDVAAAEEVVQEAFLRTFSGWWRLRQPDRADRYLRTTVVNLARSRVRRRAVEGSGNRTVWAGELVRAHSEWDVERTGDVMAILDALRVLPPRQRQAVVLRYYADLPEAEVATALGCSVGTVKSQLFKARATLARALGSSSLTSAEPRLEGK